MSVFRLISHDVAEIFKLARRMIALENGRIIKDASPMECFAPQGDSRKFALSGELLALRPADTVMIATVAIGSSITEIVLSAHEAQNFTIGESVLIAAKAFNPIISKLTL